MKRFHVHLSVADLEANIRFYSNLFGTEPTVTKPDYAKWMLEEPCINFAISNRQSTLGLNHLGIQTDQAEELAELRNQMDSANAAHRTDETNTGCCYAVSNKHWVLDPQGIAWEGFQTLGEIPTYNADKTAHGGTHHDVPTSTQQSQSKTSSCCIPLASALSSAPVSAQANPSGQDGCCVPSSKASNTSCCG